MQVFKEKEALVAEVERLKANEKKIGLVPTMGALHEGHLFLVRQALAATDAVIVSIFVNPTQFDNHSDLEKYPRTLSTDIALIEDLNKDIIVFAPSASNLYEGNINSESFGFGGLENEMEGKFRKGHFNGVATVVKIFLKIIRPDKAFFGEKDFQQLQIVQKLVKLEKLPVEIVGCPIHREINGLARSSRNERLDPELRQKAAIIYQILLQVKRDFGTKSVLELKNWVQKQFDNIDFLQLEYFEIANSKTLKGISRKRKNTSYRAFIAAYAGDIRLIDNIALND